MVTAKLPKYPNVLDEGLRKALRNSLIRKALLVGARRLEQLSKTPEKTPFSETGGTESGTVDSQSVEVAPDLAIVIKSWPSLPREAQKWILGVIQAASVAAQFGVIS